MKKNFLFGLLAILLAGFGFGGVSLADDCSNVITSGTLISCISAGNNIKMGEDIEVTEEITVNKEITLNLNGKIISKASTQSEHGIINVNENGNLTIIDSSEGEQKGGVKILNKASGTAIVVNAGGTLTINDGEYEGGTVIYVKGVNAKATINNGIFTGTRAGNSAAIHATVHGLITIAGGTFKAEPNSSGKPQKVIYAGANNNKCGAADQDYIIEGGTININTGYFEGRLSRSNSGTYNIEGGIFKIYQDKTAGVGCDYTVCDTLGSSEPNPPVYKGDPSSCKNFSGMAAMLNPGYIAVPTGENGVYTVQTGQTVAVTFSTDGKTANTVVYVRNGDTISEPAPTKFSREEDGEFDWYDENGVFDFNTPITSDITLYGKWKHTVSFDKNGGEGTIANQEIRDGDKVNKPANPTKGGEVFAGWFNGNDAFDFGVALTNINPLAITLTGKWEAMSDSTGGVETPEGETFTGVILEPEETTLTGEDTILVAVASSNSTASMEGVVELNVFKDVDGDGTKDAGTDTLLTGKVNFTAPKVVRIPVNTNSGVIVKVKHNGQTGFTTEGLTKSSTANCTGGVATPAYSGDPITPTSGYVEIYTCSASTFIAYVETPKPVVQGGGGGGSSSYSCKSLPANAVANNTTKPKKNTNYSYSTDTGAVCTFQCKTGYTWNEKDSKCEKADETVADTETNKDETTATEDTENSDTSATEDLQKVLEDGYNVEFHKAYEFAFQNGITTMPTIEEADMNGNLNRIAMAKMLSQYAINILGKTPDTTREVPNFPDVDAQLDADYNNGVTLAYQLGIMGINIDEFRPFDLVTRAEFGTALSRMLFGLADGEGDAYYSTHLEKLMSEGIITNDNPRLDELRGYVMIMLMRSANK